MVSKPLTDIETELRRKYRLSQALLGVSIEKEEILFTFAGENHSQDARSSEVTTTVGASSSTPNLGRRRRKRRIRNRTKTRGWDVVAKMKNSRGQTCTIYRPFVDALSESHLARREAYSTVRKIITQNGNDPNPATVEYFLDNTIEYLSAAGGAKDSRNSH